jgi:phosphate:Na+ symporter
MTTFTTLQAFFLVLSSVILFIFGLQNFSKEVEAWGAERLAVIFEKWTRYRFTGFLLGAIATGILQSSSAISSIIIALVESKIITFAQSLSILIGTNVGTVITAQLVAFKLTGIGPIFIVIGFFFGFHRLTKIAGKSIFYFGFILFALDLIGTSLASLNTSFNLREYLLLGKSIPSGIFYGALFTMLVQSSSVTTGLIILFVQQDMIGLSMAVPMILGANIGTTTTGLMVAWSMGKTARMTAVANFLFNAIGVIIFIPFLGIFITYLKTITNDPVLSVAQVHLWFNLINALIFLAILAPFKRFVIYIFEYKNNGKITPQ